jgi:hypothetical protein
MDKIFQAMKHGLEVAYIYLYIFLAIIFGSIICFFLFILPKKAKDNFTYDGYDL